MNLLFWPPDAPFMSALRMSIRLRPGLAIVGAFLILILILVVAVPARKSRPSADAPRVFEVDLRASAGTTAQLFWSSDDQFSEAQSVRVPLHPLRGEFERLVFPIPPRGIRWLRFDLTDAPGDVLIGRARLLDSSGVLIEEFDAAANH